jgi:hypothetical protein
MSEVIQYSTKSSGTPRWLIFPMLAVYLAIVVLLFVYWVQPSLVGENNRHITADSVTYLYFADALRTGHVDAYVAGSLYTFPNTLWGAVLLALLLPNTFNAMLFHLGIFCFALWLFSKAVDIDPAFFLLLLALNPTTTISLMAVNKELLDLLSLSIFLYYLRSRSLALLALALLISIVSRFETCVTMTVFLFLRSRLNPLRGQRLRSLLAYCVIVDILVAIVLRLPSQAIRLEEAELTATYSGGTSLFLNGLEQHFLYVLVVIPKLLENLFGEVLNVSHWFAFNMQEPATTFIVFGNNLANVVIISLLLFQRRLTLRSSVIYYASLIAITMSISVVIQPRYFYGFYVLLCLEAARRIPFVQQPTFTRTTDAAS